jgi:hypothetical protein
MEHSEESKHAGHSGNRMIGLTMGLIGVLIALCAAQVGGARNELSRNMIEQTQATADAASASTKYRIVMIDIEHLRAEPAATVPTQVRERFVRLFSDYQKEREITAAWAASYQPLVEADFKAAELFERAQLIAEIAIVFASLAVLMSSHPAWYFSIVLAVCSMGQMGWTYVSTHRQVEPILEQVEVQRDAYQELRRVHTADHSDEAAVDALDPGGVIRKAIGAAEHPAAEAAH